MSIIKNFEEFVNEGLWSKTFDRARDGQLRKEEGKKVMTPFGVEITLLNPNCNYRMIMQDILDGDDDLGVDLDNLGNFGADQRDIKSGKCEFHHMVDDRIVASYQSYEDLIEDEILDESEVSRNDYLHIIEGVTEALKKTEIDRKRGSGYDYEAVFVLIDESTVWHYECELSDSTRDYYFDDFKSCFEDAFPDVELEYWSYNNYASNIGVSINYDNLVNYQEMREWVQDFFKTLKETYEENDDE